MVGNRSDAAPCVCTTGVAQSEMVTDSMMQPNDDKVRAIMSAPTQKAVSQLKAYLDF